MVRSYRLILLSLLTFDSKMLRKIHSKQGFMKKTNQNNDMRAEYDLASMKGGIRGKYAKRYREGTNLVLLEPDVSEAFPTDKAVNQALRGISR
jgi:hypothetical protein